jgi:hypothetical protein
MRHARRTIQTDWRISKMTRKFLLGTLTATLGFALAGGVMLAQRGNRQPPSVDEQVKRLTDRLSLSSDQQSKIKPILEGQRQQMESVRNDSSLSREDRMAKMRSIRESTTSKIKDSLNDDQKKQYEAMQQEMRGRQGQKRDQNKDQ